MITALLEDRYGFQKTIELSEPLPYIDIPVTSGGSAQFRCPECGAYHPGYKPPRKKRFTREEKYDEDFYLYREQPV